MKDQNSTLRQDNEQAADDRKPYRKPFVVPQLRREAGLTEATAERTFTFQSVS